MIHFKPELLSPAGTVRNMRFALAYGADAVYAGPPRYSLRARNNEFSIPVLKKGIEEVHQQGKKFYCTVNLLPHNAKLKTFERDISEIIECQPDALIMADPGLIALTRKRWKDIPIHLSVQANAVNWAAVQFWHESANIERVILSRELSLQEIADIQEKCPSVELEVFVHGALCIAYSGRCLLSGYFNHRDPNQGTCTNACRWNYKVYSDNDEHNRAANPNIQEIAPPQHTPLLLEEEKRPGSFMPIEEDEHGTYIMNSKDLRALEHVEALTKMGVHCLKIEGRTKSHYYVARTAQVYRQAIDAAASGGQLNPAWFSDLENLANRGYTDGFFQRHQTEEYQNYIDSHSRTRKQQFCGEVQDFSNGIATVLTKNKIAVGDKIELIQPEGNQDVVVEYIEDEKGNRLEEAKGGGMTIRMPLPEIKAPELTLMSRYIPEASLIAMGL